MTLSKDDGLKYPLVIVIVGILFIFAPVFNFSFSLFVDNVPGWYSPIVWWEWAPRMVKTEYLWQALITLSGISMLIKQKWSWAFASVVLAVITGRAIMNAILLPLMSGNPMDQSQFIFIGSSMGILILLFYFRYPYLDRRESLFGINFRRYKLDKDAKIHVSDKVLQVHVKNLSTSGFYCECAHENIEIGMSGLLAHLVEANLPFKIVRQDERGFGGKFDFQSKEQRKHLKEWINLNLK